MSMLGARDNERHSYLELVDSLRQYGAMPQDVFDDGRGEEEEIDRAAF